jgi:hypothetical protein
MTESDWWACQEPQKMLAFLRTSEKLSERKGRLFAVAVCRRIWHLLSDERARRAVESAERFADRLASDEDLAATYEAVCRLVDQVAAESGETSPYGVNFASLAGADGTAAALCFNETFTALASFYCSYPAAYNSDAEVPTLSAEYASWAAAIVATASHPVTASEEVYAERKSVFEKYEASEKVGQAAILRDIFCPWPFSPKPVIAEGVLTWDNGCIVKLAAGIYEEAAFDRLPVLGDALEEAGVTDEEILAHLRSPGPHCRGCWVVDLVLGKE